MQRRFKPIKDLSVLILAPRRHDRQLWAELLKNCGINHPVAHSDIEQANAIVGSGQADVVFVDDSYGAKGIASVLVPARGVEFAGGRGVCLILCSKKATAQDVMNARKLGFASLVILPASTDTVRKHLELAARYVRPSDEELGWSAPKQKAEETSQQAMPSAKDDPAEGQATSGEGKGNAALKSGAIASPSPTDHGTAISHDEQVGSLDQDADVTASPAAQNESLDSPPLAAQGAGSEDRARPAAARPDDRSGMSRNRDEDGDDLPSLTAPGRSGRSADEEMVFL